MNTKVEDPEFWAPVPIYTIINRRLSSLSRDISTIASEIANSKQEYNLTSTLLYEQHLKTQYLDYFLNYKSPDTQLFMATKKAFNQALPTTTDEEKFELLHLQIILQDLQETISDGFQYIQQQREEQDLLECVRLLFL